MKFSNYAKRVCSFQKCAKEEDTDYRKLGTNLHLNHPALLCVTFQYPYLVCIIIDKQTVLFFAALYFPLLANRFTIYYQADLNIATQLLQSCNAIHDTHMNSPQEC